MNENSQNNSSINKLHLINEQNETKNITNNFKRKQQKSKTIKNEVPDELINLNSSIKKQEQLFQGRKGKKRMTQLEKNIDLPDTLLRLDEFKKINVPKNSHVVKKLTSTSLNPDLPDVLEPIEEIITNNLPKPYTIKEERKNQETDIINNVNSENININNINIEEKNELNRGLGIEEKMKEIEEEKRKLEEEKRLFEEKKQFEEEQKKLNEEKIIEEQNRLQEEYKKLEQEKKIEEEKIQQASNKLKEEQDKLLNDQKKLEDEHRLLEEKNGRDRKRRKK